MNIQCPACSKELQIDHGSEILKCSPQLHRETKPGQDPLQGYVHNVGKRGRNGKLDEFSILPMIRK